MYYKNRSLRLELNYEYKVGKTKSYYTKEELFDQVTQRLAAGESLDAILADHPEHIAILSPLLRAASQLQKAAVEPLPAELDAWLPQGRRRFVELLGSASARATTFRRKH